MSGDDDIERLGNRRAFTLNGGRPAGNEIKVVIRVDPDDDRLSTRLDGGRLDVSTPAGSFALPFERHRQTVAGGEGGPVPGGVAVEYLAVPFEDRDGVLRRLPVSALSSIEGVWPGERLPETATLRDMALVVGGEDRALDLARRDPAPPALKRYLTEAVGAYRQWADGEDA